MHLKSEGIGVKSSDQNALFRRHFIPGTGLTAQDVLLDLGERAENRLLDWDV